MSDRTWSDIGDSARDVAGHAYADIGNHYQQFLTGRPAPMTSMPGVMETTTHTDSEVGPPESYASAMLKHGVAEGAERELEHWREYSTNGGASEQGQHSIVYPHEVGEADGMKARGSSAPGSEANGWERYSAGHGASDAGQGHYGVGPASASPSAATQETDAHEPEL